jgi:hypothetical protein
MASSSTSNDNEPFVIGATERPALYPRRAFQGRDPNNGGGGEAKIEEEADDSRRFKHGNNLRRRFRRRNESNDGGEDEEKGEDLNTKPAAEESNDVEPSKSLSRQSSRLRQTISTAEPNTIGPNKPHRLSMPLMHHSNYIRKPPDEKLKDKFKQLRAVAEGVPEVHFIGELMEGVGFKDTFASCKW